MEVLGEEIRSSAPPEDDGGFLLTSCRLALLEHSFRRCFQSNLFRFRLGQRLVTVRDEALQLPLQRQERRDPARHRHLAICATILGSEARRVGQSAERTSSLVRTIRPPLAPIKHTRRHIIAPERRCHPLAGLGNPPSVPEWGLSARSASFRRLSDRLSGQTICTYNVLERSGNRTGITKKAPPNGKGRNGFPPSFHQPDCPRPSNTNSWPLTLSSLCLHCPGHSYTRGRLHYTRLM
ncbi:unnamed protein product [Protopolystoma xenopodis]|uniref:Uncharacterized protein n=1 Tax=Protopolystoma xenopodis TaxID=117903 RepID=A0A3S5ABX9_9PLAT|nr:unnamed protein product [Protopolystoma xenopodis]